MLLEDYEGFIYPDVLQLSNVVLTVAEFTF